MESKGNIEETAHAPADGMVWNIEEPQFNVQLNSLLDFGNYVNEKNKQKAAFVVPSLEKSTGKDLPVKKGGRRRRQKGNAASEKALTLPEMEAIGKEHAKDPEAFNQNYVYATLSYVRKEEAAEVHGTPFLTPHLMILGHGSYAKDAFRKTMNALADKNIKPSKRFEIGKPTLIPLPENLMPLLMRAKWSEEERAVYHETLKEQDEKALKNMQAYIRKHHITLTRVMMGAKHGWADPEEKVGEKVWRWIHKIMEDAGLSLDYDGYLYDKNNLEVLVDEHGVIEDDDDKDEAAGETAKAEETPVSAPADAAETKAPEAKSQEPPAEVEDKEASALKAHLEQQFGDVTMTTGNAAKERYIPEDLRGDVKFAVDDTLQDQGAQGTTFERTKAMSSGIRRSRRPAPVPEELMRTKAYFYLVYFPDHEVQARLEQDMYDFLQRMNAEFLVVAKEALRNAFAAMQWDMPDLETLAAETLKNSTPPIAPKDITPKPQPLANFPHELLDFDAVLEELHQKCMANYLYEIEIAKLQAGFQYLSKRLVADLEAQTITEDQIEAIYAAFYAKPQPFIEPSPQDLKKMAVSIRMRKRNAASNATSSSSAATHKEHDVFGLNEIQRTEIHVGDGNNVEKDLSEQLVKDYADPTLLDERDELGRTARDIIRQRFWKRALESLDVDFLLSGISSLNMKAYLRLYARNKGVQARYKYMRQEPAILVLAKNRNRDKLNMDVGRFEKKYPWLRSLQTRVMTSFSPKDMLSFSHRTQNMIDMDEEHKRQKAQQEGTEYLTPIERQIREMRLKHFPHMGNQNV